MQAGRFMEIAPNIRGSAKQPLFQIIDGQEFPTEVPQGGQNRSAAIAGEGPAKLGGPDGALIWYNPCLHLGAKIVKIVVVKEAWMAYLLPKVHRFWCEGKPFLPYEMHRVTKQKYDKHRRNE